MMPVSAHMTHLLILHFVPVDSEQGTVSFFMCDNFACKGGWHAQRDLVMHTSTCGVQLAEMARSHSLQHLKRLALQKKDHRLLFR